MRSRRPGAKRRGRGGIEVKLDCVDLHRDGRAILRGIDWRLRPGQRWIVCGENGAGKTQLLKLCAGAVWPDPASAARLQYLSASGRSIDPVEAIPEIAYVGPERQDRYERYGWNFTALEIVGTGLTRSDIPQGALKARAARAAREILRSFGIARLAMRRFLTLSYGERRLVLVARAVATRPKILLLDETLGGLDERNRSRMARWFARESSKVPSWVLTTHRREEIPQGATHFLELDAGVVRSAGPIESAKFVATKIAKQTRRAARDRGPMLVALRAAHVYLDYHHVLHDLDLEIRRGDCWVVHGANGAGKSTLLRTLYGDHSVALGGAIERRGIRPGVPLATFRQWCALVAPHLQSDPPRGETVLETIVSGLRRTVGLDGPPRAEERRRAGAAARTLDLGQHLQRPLRELSYGQVRRVLFARALVTRPRLLLLDEPFGGVDLGTRTALRERIDGYIAGGGTVVMSSHHTDEWPDGVNLELELGRGRVLYRGAPRSRTR